jgi:lipopolysaccharide/colanic/teichoic acid biosynthesis glycosyltransferase
MKTYNYLLAKKSNILKRFLDVVISLFLLIVLLPILIIASIVILIREGSPVFYISQRAVNANKTIRVTKFRTMARDATSSKYKLNELFMRDGYLDIPLNHEVYTPTGRFLERTQLVEAFQLFNIFKNEMSLVGNRPLPNANLELLKVFPHWEERFESPCGITGISQVVGKYDLQPHQRIRLEVMYSSIYNNPNANILECDLIIIWYTIKLLFLKKYLRYEEAIKILIDCGASSKL